MITIFPEFRPIQLEDKEHIESFTSIFPPYSDFNFISLWAWNIDNKIKLSNLNNNLVVRFQDYIITSKYFYSFIGDKKIPDTLQALFNLSKSEGLEEELKLVPFHNFLNSNLNELSEKFSLTEDMDNYDYVLGVEKIAKMEGSDLHQKRKLLNKFLESYKYTVINKSLLDPGIRDEILNFFYYWEKSRDKKKEETESELNAIKRLFIKPELLNVTVQCVYVNNHLAGYTLFELIDKEYTVSDFQKGDTKHRGIYELLNYSMANFLAKKGCKYVNIEQDLGIEGLRRSKLDYRPVKLLKKYTIRLK